MSREQDRRGRSFSRSGFTLIELLVSIGIIAVLAGLSAAGALSVRESGRKVREIGAARNLITAYVNTPMDNDGRYLPGYDRTVSEVQWPNGTSAAFDTGSSTIRGFNILTPPNIYGPMWKASPWKKGSNPGDYGNVDPRYDGKAVCAFLDGSVRLLGIEELRDMTLWNCNARAENNPNYVVSAAAAPSGPRRR